MPRTSCQFVKLFPIAFMPGSHCLEPVNVRLLSLVRSTKSFGCCRRDLGSLFLFPVSLSSTHIYWTTLQKPREPFIYSTNSTMQPAFYRFFPSMFQTRYPPVSFSIPLTLMVILYVAGFSTLPLNSRIDRPAEGANLGNCESTTPFPESSTFDLL